MPCMKGKSLDVLAHSEVIMRWPGHGISRLDDVTIIFLDMALEDCHNRCRGVASCGVQ